MTKARNKGKGSRKQARNPGKDTRPNTGNQRVDDQDCKSNCAGEKERVNVNEDGNEDGNGTATEKEEIPDLQKQKPEKDKKLSPKEQRKFSRRKVESNWDRYDEDSDETDETVLVPLTKANSGADFQTLVSQAGTGSSQFRFHDELEWDSTQDSSRQVSSNNDDLGLGLNLLALGTSLGTIPLAVKLNLSDKSSGLFAIEKDESICWLGEYLELQKQREIVYLQRHQDNIDEDAPSLKPAVDLPEWTFAASEDLALSVNKLLSKMNQSSEENSLNVDDIYFNDHTEPEQEIPIKTKTVKSQEHSVPKLCPSLAEQHLNNENLYPKSRTGNDIQDGIRLKENLIDDEDLDELLSITSPVKTSVTKYENSVDSTDVKCIENCQDNETEHQDTDTQTQLQTVTNNSTSELKSELLDINSSKNNESNAEDLEDWLDSILD